MARLTFSYDGMTEEFESMLQLTVVIFFSHFSLEFRVFLLSSIDRRLFGQHKLLIRHKNTSPPLRLKIKRMEKMLEKLYLHEIFFVALPPTTNDNKQRLSPGIHHNPVWLRSSTFRSGSRSIDCCDFPFFPRCTMRVDWKYGKAETRRIREWIRNMNANIGGGEYDLKSKAKNFICLFALASFAKLFDFDKLRDKLRQKSVQKRAQPTWNTSERKIKALGKSESREYVSNRRKHIKFAPGTNIKLHILWFTLTAISET